MQRRALCLARKARRVKLFALAPLPSGCQFECNLALMCPRRGLFVCRAGQKIPAAAPKGKEQPAAIRFSRTGCVVCNTQRNQKLK